MDTIQEYLDDARIFSEVVSLEDDKSVAGGKAGARTVLQELLSNSAGETGVINQEINKTPLMLSAWNQDSKSILKINEFLESGLKQGEISETLYGHLKGEYLI